MKLYLRILLCILLATSSECKTNLFKDIAEYVYNLFTLGLDVGDRLESNEQLEKVQKSLNKLEEAMNRVQSMKDKVDDLDDLIEITSYYDSFQQDI